ncbi:polysaccharide deacetylase family protein [Paenibacillus sp.]|uniref:polysaccharide deacetylase family protein n=1 Tax=Paenibacillus sp. TaxID=58172 RepID=UPI002D6D91C4|nr:polysaccharide deacetylase family protein [Paenibacillus sp.]HZG87849.1 polysaccharide deacetylase family protein [Paenibacillus sp.]
MKQIVKCFPGGKHKVLTMSYDDGREADRRLVGIFNQYGIKGTFHLNSGLLGAGDRIGADEIASLYAGHEVSAHTVTHPTIARSPKEALVHEIMEDRKALERLTGYTVRGMSYPNGSYSPAIMDLLPHLGIEYARTVHSTKTFGFPNRWHEWNPTCHHNHDVLEIGKAFAELHKRQYLYMMYVWGHSYEFNDRNNWDVIERFCEFIGGRDDIWYATNIEIYDYLQACDRLQFSAACDFVYNPSAMSVWLSVGGDIVEAKGGARTTLE